jgi:hypothetical protein
MGSRCRALNAELGATRDGALAGVAFTTREVRALTGGAVHGVHAAGSVNDDGEVVLGVLRPNGAVLCSAVGTLDFDTGCLAVSGCGGLADVCLDPATLAAITASVGL